MTRDEIIAMAREAGFVLSDNATDEAIGRFASFAALVVADEREPLTDEQIAVACGWKPGCVPLPKERDIARAIERAHGIT